MCLLVVLRGVDPDYPLLIAANRDEHRDRRFSPPGLSVEDRSWLSPKDRARGGTWIGVNDGGVFAGITNYPAAVGATPVGADAPSRGALPHLVLGHGGDVAAALGAVAARVRGTPFAPFQLLVASPDRVSVLRWDGVSLEEKAAAGPVAAITNEHPLGRLRLPTSHVEAATADGLGVDERLDELEPLLLDTGVDGEGRAARHRILKAGGEWGTVSSSLIAVPHVPSAGHPAIRGLRWRYCAGSPDERPFKNYGNLARRLVRDSD